MNQQIANQNNGEIDANEEDEDDMAEEILFESPLDDVDPYICFEQVFRGNDYFTFLLLVKFNLFFFN